MVLLYEMLEIGCLEQIAARLIGAGGSRYRDVRFTPKSGHCCETDRCPLSAKSRHIALFVSGAPPLPSVLAIEEQDASFVVRDGNGQALAYIYFEDAPAQTQGYTIAF